MGVKTRRSVVRPSQSVRLAQRKQTHLYYRYLRRIRDTYTDARNLGRTIQTLVSLHLEIVSDPLDGQEIRMYEQWEWKPTGMDVYGREEDSDMLDEMLAVKWADDGFENLLELGFLG